MKLNKKIRELTKEEIEQLNKMLGDCKIISFDEKEISEKRNLAVNLRMAAHETLLEADLLDDEIIKTLMGINNVKSKTKSVGKHPKARKLGR